MVKSGKGKVPSRKRSAPPKTPLKTKIQKSKANSKVTSFGEEVKQMGTQFRIDPANLKKGVKAVLQLNLEKQKAKNELFEDDIYPILLQVNTIKSPKIHPKIFRLPVKHSIFTPESEVCLIVADVKGVPNKDHEKHLEHYEKLLMQKGVNNVKKVMTFHEFRTEYDTFEMKRRLVELYDVFLADSKISGKVVSKCGKIFYKKRKIPSAVKLQVTKLKEHIDQTLKKTPLYFHSKGDSFVVEVGHSKMKTTKVAENIFYALKGLDEKFPGGFGNVRSLNIFGQVGTSVPIYTTLKNQNEVDQMKIKNVEKVQLRKTVSGELSTRLDTNVTVTPTGRVTVHQNAN